MIEIYTCIKALDTIQDPPILEDPYIIEDPFWTNEAKDRLEDPLWI